MTKKKVVVFYFDKRTPRVFVNPKNLSELQKEGDILVNPNIPKGVGPEFWRLVNGKIRGPVTIEKAFPEDKHIEPSVFRWFKPFVLTILAGLIVLNLYREKESIINLMEFLK
jgi:hypothetical protein